MPTQKRRSSAAPAAALKVGVKMGYTKLTASSYPKSWIDITALLGAPLAAWDNINPQDANSPNLGVEI